jgi:hypothetical protein
VPFLERLQPGQAFVDRDLSHRSTSAERASLPASSDDDDAIVVEWLSSESRRRVTLARSVGMIFSS